MFLGGDELGPTERLLPAPLPCLMSGPDCKCGPNKRSNSPVKRRGCRPVSLPGAARPSAGASPRMSVRGASRDRGRPRTDLIARACRSKWPSAGGLGPVFVFTLPFCRPGQISAPVLSCSDG